MKCILKIFSITFLLTILYSCKEAKSPPGKPLNLRTEYLANPVGLDVAIPRFSWEMNDTTRGASQSAYRILVASSLEQINNNKGDIWDPGKTESEQSHLVEYKGAVLNSRQTCYWKVMIFDQNRQPSEYSDVNSFEMGLLNPGNWEAKWIGNSESGKPPRSVMFRKDFEVKGDIKTSRIYISGLGTYLLYLNGVKVGNDLLAPGWTDYHKKVQYQVYDLSGLTKHGKNTVGVVLGNMWWSSGLGWQGSGGASYSNGPLRFIAQLEFQSADGLIKVLSDNSWKGTYSPYVENTIYNGVTYDARLDQKGWNEAGFNDSKWKAANIVEMQGIKMVAQQEPPIRISEMATPVNISEPKHGIYVFDFGINMVGYCKLKIKAPKGTVIQLRYAELLHPDGTVAQENLRSARVTDYYICKGEAVEEFEPYLTYHGFQYVQVTGLPFKPDKQTLTGLIFNSSVESAGTFTCSSEIINSIQANIIRGERGNLFSVPTDCPQRDERLGWMGDAQIFGPTACYNMNLARFFSKWERDIIDSQDEKEGYVFDVNPAIVVGGPSKPGWGDAVIVIPYVVYKFYGDKRIIEENYEGMKKWVEYMKGKSINNLYTWANEDSSWFGYGDWIAVEHSPSKPISQEYYYYSTKLLAEMADLIGKAEEANELNKRLPAIKEAFNKAYFNADSNSYTGGTQTANLIPIAFQLTGEEYIGNVMKSVADNVTAKGYHLTTGFLGTSLLLPMLSDHGYHELAYKTAIQTTYPSWGYMVKQGATSMWELWNSDKEKPEGMNSRNHFALGSVGEWYYGYLAGIKPDINSPGFKKTIISPKPAGDLTSAKGLTNTPYGLVSSEWEIINEAFDLTVKIPANTTAVVALPFHNKSEIFENGKLIYSNGKLQSKMDCFKLLENNENEVVLDVRSGKYHFRVK